MKANTMTAVLITFVITFVLTSIGTVLYIEHKRAQPFDPVKMYYLKQQEYTNDTRRN